MADYFEIDFLSVETKKSGDAIALRYQLGENTYIHVVDGGFHATGDSMIAHIKSHYGNPSHIHHVVATHPDGDHTVGLRRILEEFTVGALWMHRPWLYADELLPRFVRYTNADNLKKRLKELYPNIAALEEIAERKGIPINEAFQGGQIGAFRVMTPTKARYLDLVVNSDRTPEGVEASATEKSILGTIMEKAAQVIAYVRSAWGEEVFSPEDTSAENEMSIVQYANIAGKKILLTGDTGRAGLAEVIAYAPNAGLHLPGIDRFQVPHHGSRRNVSTEVLDAILGERLPSRPDEGGTKFTAIISSAKEDTDHPRKSVVRAMHHRGAYVVKTEGKNISTYQNSSQRDGWSAVPNEDYPDDQEE